MTVTSNSRLVLLLSLYPTPTPNAGSSLDPVPGMPGMAADRKKSGARWVDPNVRAAQVDLERMLGVRVRIRDRKGKGRIVIEYSTVDDYERVVEMLRGKK